MTIPFRAADGSPDRPRVLVIDDDPLFRNLVVSILRRDFFVSVASDGADGFQKAIEYPPDVAVIDIQMPGWDGLKTLKAFRNNSALSRVGIMILTSDASRDTVLAAIQAGANDYVIKTTFSRVEFLEKLERLRTRAEPRPARSGPVDESFSRYSVAPQRDEDSGEKNLQAIIDAWE